MVTETQREYAPTLTAVLVSSSEARLPGPCLLLMLNRLLLLGVRIMLNRGEAAVGEAGGEPVMALYYEEEERCERRMRWNKRRVQERRRDGEVIGS